MNRFRALGIKAFEISNYLHNATEDHSHLFLYADGIHFSPRGHQLISQYIRNQLLITKQ